MEKKPILSAKDVEITFSLRGNKLNAIRKCSLDLYDGETLAIVGESGSGKSVFTKTFVGMLDGNGSITGGSIMYDGKDLAKFKKEKEWMTIRGKKIAMVMQDPMTSLNPLKKVGKQIQECIELHQGLKGAVAKKATLQILEKVGIPYPEMRYNQYPHEFSGGMRQRIVIAIALANKPKLIIAVEPTTALDVTIQAQVLELIQEMSRQTGAAVIMITHDLGVVASLCDRINIMYGGRLAETGTDREIFYEPNHPYTKGLLNCINNPEDDDKELTPIPGSPPDLLKPPAGCPFVDRCSEAMKICKTKMPVETIFSATHRSACWLNEKKNREEAQHGSTK